MIFKHCVEESKVVLDEGKNNLVPPPPSSPGLIRIVVVSFLIVHVMQYANQVLRHHTFCAAAMATLASPAFISGTEAITSPLDGFVTSNVLPETAPTHSPLTYVLGPFSKDAIVLI